MFECKGCFRFFEKFSSLNSHKRFCEQWKKLDIQKYKSHIPKEEIKKIPSTCPLCSKQFENVYSMSAHKGHCMGKSSTKQLRGFLPWNKGKNKKTNKSLKHFSDFKSVSLKEILSGNIPHYQTNKLKKRLIEQGIFENKCSICGISEWLGKEIVCELDHINGNRHDHKLENLRILCPNCHSQTSTYCGKNKRRYN